MARCVALRNAEGNIVQGFTVIDAAVAPAAVGQNSRREKLYLCIKQSPFSLVCEVAFSGVMGVRIRRITAKRQAVLADRSPRISIRVPM
jgi:hypothetical protein